MNNHINTYILKRIYRDVCRLLVFSTKLNRQKILTEGGGKLKGALTGNQKGGFLKRFTNAPISCVMFVSSFVMFVQSCARVNYLCDLL